MARRRLRREEYTVGWVCALPIELAAAQEMLDEEHRDLEQDQHDNNIYSLGRIGEHNVVIVCLPAGLIGNSPAAAVATQLRATFSSIQFGLMVGIGGGVPTDVDVRLGDVVVSQPHQGYGGVIQYDFGKVNLRGFQRTGFLNTPPAILLSAVAKMRANQVRQKSKLVAHITKLRYLPEFRREAAGPDVLFEATYDHVEGPTCQSCSQDKQVDRHPRLGVEPVVHYGTIASGNQVIKNAAERDSMSKAFGGVRCFEMEAAGLMNSFPCLVIRGICDYADSHKNKKWQAYAAATAAACAKEVLSVIPPAEVAKACTVNGIINTTGHHVLKSSDGIPFHQPIASRYPTAQRNKSDETLQARSALIAHSLGHVDCNEAFLSDTNTYFEDLVLNSLLNPHYQALEAPFEALREAKQQTDVLKQVLLQIFRRQSTDLLEPYTVPKLSTDKPCISPTPRDRSTVPTVLTTADKTPVRPGDKLASSTRPLNLDPWRLIRTTLGGMTRRDFESGFRRVMAIIFEFGSMIQHNIQGLSPKLVHAFILLKFILFSSVMAVLRNISLRSPLKLEFIFEDVLGRQHGLDFNYFRDWNTFKSMLEGQFRDCPGEEKVIKGEYRLMNPQRYYSILSSENWADLVGPGTRVVMSILVKQLRRIKGGCPRKDCQGSLEVVEEQRSICNTCKIEISYSPESPRVVELPNDANFNNMNEYQNSAAQREPAGGISAQRPEQKASQSGVGRQYPLTPRPNAAMPGSRIKAVRKLKEKIAISAERILQDEINHLRPTQRRQTNNELHLFRRIHTTDIEAFPVLQPEPVVSSTEEENSTLGSSLGGQDGSHDHSKDKRQSFTSGRKPKRRIYSASDSPVAENPLADGRGWRTEGSSIWRPIGQPGVGLLKIIEYQS